MCLLPPKPGHTRVSPRRPAPGTLIMPSTCLFIPTCFPLLSPGLCVTPPRSYCPHTCSPPLTRVFPASTPSPLLTKVSLLPPFYRPIASLSYPLSRPPTPRLLSHLPNPPMAPSCLSLPVSPLTEEDAAGAGGPVRLHEAAAKGAGLGAGRAVPYRAEPPRPRGPNQRVLPQRPAAFHSGISIPGLQLLLTPAPALTRGLLTAQPSPGHPPGPRQQPPQRWGGHTGHLQSQEAEGIKTGE